LSSSWWESLESDTIPWLLDEEHPSLLWRALVELVGRPSESPAVGRARGGANAAEPVAALLVPLRPDGNWELDGSPWRPWGGSAWRIIAAAQWGADPSDPRLSAALEHMLENRDLHFRTRHPCAWARWLQAAAELGWGSDPRLEECVARFEAEVESLDTRCWTCAEPATDAADSGACVVTAVAATGMVAAAPALHRRPVADWAVGSVLEALGRDSAGDSSPRYLAGHPNLARTDSIEALWALARAGVPYDRVMAPALLRVQEMQDEWARWRREVPAPEPAGGGRKAGDVSRWVTLRALVALRHYAEAAGLPRLFPERPHDS